MSHGRQSKNIHDAESLLQGQEALSRVALATFSLNEANWKIQPILCITTFGQLLD